MSRRFHIEPLAPSHRRDLFSCGSPPLDRYIREQATQDIRRKVSNCFVVISDKLVVAYYTFASTSILLADLPLEVTRRLPRYPLVPGALIGRLAVDQTVQGQGLGGALLLDAAQRADHADPAIHSLVVEAKDEGLTRFYQSVGFRSLSSAPQRLYLPVATAIAAIKASHPSRSDS